jgi:hypothetical protein
MRRGASYAVRSSHGRSPRCPCHPFNGSLRCGHGFMSRSHPTIAPPLRSGHAACSSCGAASSPRSSSTPSWLKASAEQRKTPKRSRSLRLMRRRGNNEHDINDHAVADGLSFDWPAAARSRHARAAARSRAQEDERGLPHKKIGRSAWWLKSLKSHIGSVEAAPGTRHQSMSCVSTRGTKPGIRAAVTSSGIHPCSDRHYFTYSNGLR